MEAALDNWWILPEAVCQIRLRERWSEVSNLPPGKRVREAMSGAIRASELVSKMQEAVSNVVDGKTLDYEVKVGELSFRTPSGKDAKLNLFLRAVVVTKFDDAPKVETPVEPKAKTGISKAAKKIFGKKK